ncbi:MAG: Hsp70 family protein [Verrucomicrobiales bacterium]
MDETLIIGIDLGTTNSLVGVVDSGFPIILADENGNRLVPSAVAFPPDGEPLTGREALRSGTVAPERTITSIKRFIGRRFSQLSEAEKSQAGFPLESTQSDGIRVRIGENAYATPEEISAILLGRLKTIAEAALEEPVERAVVTVPAYFSHSQREATKWAAESAGFVVERIVNEPTAAALAYGLDKLDDTQSVAVYDFGGGTFDLSILQMRNGLFEVVSTAGDTQLGGDDLDRAVAEALGNRLPPGQLTTEQYETLKTRAREAKEALSEQETFTVRLPFFRDGESFEIELSRDDLEKIVAPVIERTRPICQRAFAEAGNKRLESVDRLILVGGSTRIPLVRERLETWFGLEPNLSQHPDEAVGLGAAIQAGILCGRVRDVVLVDVTPLSLGIETFGGLMNVIVPRNSTIPTKAGEMFTNAVDGQESMTIRILQGEREMAKDNWLLGEIHVPFARGPKGTARVGVQFALDQNGILGVLVRDTATGEDHVLEIRDSAVDVDDDAVEKMVSESIDHAFDDMNERVWTEAKMKSEELLPAVGSALEAMGDRLSEEEVGTIKETAAEIERILGSDVHDAKALKAANQALDDATQTLAAMLLEAAYSEPDSSGPSSSSEREG